MTEQQKHANDDGRNDDGRLAILIAGPTASGKSALALNLAERLRGLVINADSMQVYRDLRVLTARPTDADEARAPHALYGFVDAADAYSVGRYLSDASAALTDADARALVPIFVGGTGLYFRALEEGLAALPAIDPKVRAHWRTLSDELPATALHDRLADRDAVMAARLRPSDTQRIVRALEVIDSTGRSLADWQAAPQAPGPLHGRRLIKCVLAPTKDELRASVVERFRAMVAGGGLDEAARLAARQLSPSLPAMRAIGVAPLVAVARGEMDLEVATLAAERDTLRYVKRQLTWLKSYMISWNGIQTKETESQVAEIIAFIER